MLFHRRSIAGEAISIIMSLPNSAAPSSDDASINVYGSIVRRKIAQQPTPLKMCDVTATVQYFTTLAKHPERWEEARFTSGGLTILYVFTHKADLGGGISLARLLKGASCSGTVVVLTPNPKDWVSVDGGFPSVSASWGRSLQLVSWPHATSLDVVAKKMLAFDLATAPGERIATMSTTRESVCGSPGLIQQAEMSAPGSARIRSYAVITQDAKSASVFEYSATGDSVISQNTEDWLRQQCAGSSTPTPSPTPLPASSNTWPIRIDPKWTFSGPGPGVQYTWRNGGSSYQFSILTLPYKSPTDYLDSTDKQEQVAAPSITHDRSMRCGMLLETATNAYRFGTWKALRYFLHGRPFEVMYRRPTDTPEDPNITALLNACPTDLMLAQAPTGWKSSNTGVSFSWWQPETANRIEFAMKPANDEPIDDLGINQDATGVTTSTTTSCEYPLFIARGTSNFGKYSQSFIHVATQSATLRYEATYSYDGKPDPDVLDALKGICVTSPVPEDWYVGGPKA